jgi:opacity protein-like surface antigen
MCGTSSRGIRLSGLFVLIAFCATLSFAQEFPRMEVYGGYSLLNLDTNNQPSRQYANGWEGAFSVNLTNRFAVEDDVSNYHKTLLGTSLSDWYVTGGPRLNFHQAFIHVLAGAEHLTGSLDGQSASKNSLAVALGGGLQFKIRPNWAVRTSLDYLATHHNLYGGSGMLQNDIRIGGGIVYMFGSR